MPSFTLYLMAFFCSPLYFLSRKKWGGFVFNLTLYLFAILLFFVFFIGVIPWAIGVAHASWHIRDELMHRQAELIARQIKST